MKSKAAKLAFLSVFVIGLFGITGCGEKNNTERIENLEKAIIRLEKELNQEICEHRFVEFEEGAETYEDGNTIYFNYPYYIKKCAACGKVLKKYKNEKEYLVARLKEKGVDAE